MLPTALKNISEAMFSSCTSLSDIIIPEGVESIDAFAFSACDNLESITLPKSLKRVGEYAFLACSNLAEVHISNKASWDSIEWGEMANPLELSGAKLYLNGEEVAE